MKNAFLFHLKSTFRSRDIEIFVCPYDIPDKNVLKASKGRS